MEAVSIQLTPLGRDERDNSRHILLNKDKKEVEIGRASKNAQKGLLAASDNAWFDYPILSRTHAKFTVCLPQRTIYIQDCGSTHGTYLQKRKLEKGIEYTVGNGEIITFGQSVTSGTVTYPAKDFRVHSNWISPMREPTPPRVDQKTSSSFQVPEDDDNSSSILSREVSVQILDSHPRAFSVPTTDSESDSEDSEIEYLDQESSISAPKQVESTATTPDHGNAAKESALQGGSAGMMPNVKGRGPGCKGPSITSVLSKPNVAESLATGSSQQNAIRVEDEHLRKQSLFDIESDDEGPEKLPIQHISPRKDQINTWHEPPIAHQGKNLEDVSDEEDTDDKIEQVIKQTRARLDRDKLKRSTRGSPSNVPLDPSAGLSDDFDSADDDGFDVDDDFSYGYEETATDLKDLLGAIPDMVPGPSNAAIVSQPQKPQKPHLEAGIAGPTTFQQICPNVSASSGINVSQASQKGFPPLNRAPSPSDAALARNSFDVSIGATAPALKPLPSVLNGDVTLYNNDHSTNQGVFGGGPFTYRYHPPVSYPGVPLPSADTHVKPYSQGPFANHLRGELPPWFQGNDFVDRAESQYQIMSFNDIAADARYAAKLQAEEDPYASTAHHPGDFVDPSGCEPKSRSGSEGQSSKINISSLVNEASSDSRPSKRKADEISSLVEAEEASEFLNAGKSTNVQDLGPPQAKNLPKEGDLKETPLHDAQGRDSPPIIETIPLTQDTALDSSSKLTSNNNAMDFAETEGPARKKARKSSSPSRGIGKFVSGVCVGLAGAVAAFIATIPANVREEALRELSNAA